MYYGYMQNESLITRARNRLTNDFLATDSTHLMFIDADITFNPEYIVRMLNADKDIICGLYPKKEINWAVSGICSQKTVCQQTELVHRWTGAFVVNLVGKVCQEQHGSVSISPWRLPTVAQDLCLIKRECI
jgi:hypothetical protein